MIFNYVLVAMIIIACCGMCFLTIYTFDSAISKLSQLQQVIACQIIGMVFGSFAIVMIGQVI